SLSKTRHVEARPNLRGPSRKAKYSLATDSEPSSASERWEEPRQGEDSEPETTCLQAVRAHLSNLPLAAFAVGNDQRRSTNDERMTKLECRMTKSFRHSDFDILS